MAAPGTLLPADILSAMDNKANKLPSFSHDTGILYPRQKPSPGEGSSRSSVVDTENDNAVGSSGISKVPYNQTDRPPSSATESSPYKGILGGHIVHDDRRMNVNVVPYDKNTAEDPKNLFADLNPFQIKGFGKADDMQRKKNNIESSRPPVPLMQKSRHAINEVPKKKDYDYMESLFPRNDQNPNAQAVSTSSSKYPTNVDRVYPQYNNLNPSAQESNNWYSFKAPTEEQENDRLLAEHPTDKNLQNTIEHGNQCELLDNKKCTYDRFMGFDSKLKDSESPCSSFDSSTYSYRTDQVIDDVDVGEREIQWEDLVIGERIGLGNCISILPASLCLNH